MIDYEPRHWFSLLVQLRGSVLRNLAPRIALAAGLGALAEGLFRTTGFRIPSMGHTLLGAALGLLLVFRTNASYDRFWEGRRLLGAMTNRSRDLVRQMATLVEGDGAELRAHREALRRLVVAFYRLTAQALRDERDLAALGALLTDDERARLEPVVSRPSVVAAWMTVHAVAAARIAGASETRVLAMDANVTALVDALGGCERIRRTPVPFAYAQHIKLFVALWCATVPFALVDALRWYTPLAAAMLAFALFGIDEIGVEIEDPFGHDPNDLPVDRIGDGIDRATREILDVGGRAAG